MIDAALAQHMADEIARNPAPSTLVRAICSAGFALVPEELLSRFPEINPINYNHDDACALNAWGVEVVNAATR